MTTTTAPAAPAATGHRVFLALLPEYFGGETLPTCPDGSGDLWWDDASYARYQAYDGPIYEPEQIEREAVTADYCDGLPKPWALFDEFTASRTCACHAAEWAALQAADAPF